ncbi:shikimate dehydrogenase [Alkaliphilus pronyensis]|uniref:Shikimate dehydrogenase (NADP(+)) n=1 Tax=Alkaliphilus pronyensis TaxID=1482732 RepID=A0A6I0F5E7_9FIRM|nr:shikimate dehydrogenase [Alkaliphilus pronyensis]KAB3529233.1 shikimate dehydrogenase [Alkaliphilus pronyensis]
MKVNISSKTRMYAVIGDPISHSLSPDIHNRVFRALNLNNIYISMNIRPTYLKEAIKIMKDNYCGFNVTIPHKEKIIPYLDALDKTAKIYGAVNTVKLENGIYKGYNTDGYGFIKSLETEGIIIKGEKALILGAGGAARVIAYELAMLGCCVTIANRDLEKAYRLKGHIETTSGNTNIAVKSYNNIKNSFKLIINTTPLGMPNSLDSMVIKEEIFKYAEIAYDVIYNPWRSKFLRVAEYYGCKPINGYSMLFYQAMRSQEIWLEASLDQGITKLIYEDVLKLVY